MEKFLELFTRANITLAMSILGVLLSTFSISLSNFRSRKRLSARVLHSLPYDRDLLIILQFVNKSSAPLSITVGELQFPGCPPKRFGVTTSTRFLYQNPAISGKSAAKTELLPIRLESYESANIFAEIKEWPEEWNRFVPGPCLLRIYTSRGKWRHKQRFPIYLPSMKALLQRLE